MVSRRQKKEMQSELNNILRGTNYSIKAINWNDVSKETTVKGSLSSMGSNVTDVKLIGKNGQSFYTIRTDNWNEKIGTISAQDVAVIQETSTGLTQITLKKYLQDNNLLSSLDNKVSIRFQITFLPIEADDHGSIEFCIHSFSYNTPNSSNPKNLLLLCTTKGLALHANKNTYQKLFLYNKDKSGNLVSRWLEDKETSCKADREQIETNKQVEGNMKHGEASNKVIGTKYMDQRYNAVLTVQIPLKQSETANTSVVKRLESEHVTVTIILYHIVKGGFPTKEDVIVAITELDRLYSECTWSDTLKDISA